MIIQWRWIGWTVMGVFFGILAPVWGWSVPNQEVWQARRELHRKKVEKRIAQYQQTLEGYQKVLTEAQAGRLPLVVLDDSDGWDKVLVGSPKDTHLIGFGWKGLEKSSAQRRLLEAIKSLLPMDAEEKARWRKAIESVTWDQLVAYGRDRSKYPVRFGADLLASKEGVEVVSTAADSPAAALSLVKGDRLLKVESAPVFTPRGFFEALDGYRDGSEVHLQVKRTVTGAEETKRFVIERMGAWPSDPAVVAGALRAWEMQKQEMDRLEQDRKRVAAMSLEEFVGEFSPRLVGWGPSGPRMVVVQIPAYDPGVFVQMAPSRIASLKLIKDLLKKNQEPSQAHPDISDEALKEEVVDPLKEMEAYLNSMSDEAFEAAYRRALEDGDRKRSEGSSIRPPTSAWIGVSCETREIRRDGALVRRVALVVVAEGGPAHRAGLRPGDIILEVDGQFVADPASLGERVKQFAPGSRIPVNVVKKGVQTEEVVWVTLDPRPSGALD